MALIRLKTSFSRVRKKQSCLNGYGTLSSSKKVLETARAKMQLLRMHTNFARFDSQRVTSVGLKMLLAQIQVERHKSGGCAVILEKATTSFETLIK